MNWLSPKVHRTCRQRYPESAMHASHDLKLCGASILREVAVSRCSSCTIIHEHRTIAFRILLMALRRTALFGALGPVALDSSALGWGKPDLLAAGCTASQNLQGLPGADCCQYQSRRKSANRAIQGGFTCAGASKGRGSRSCHLHHHHQRSTLGAAKLSITMSAIIP